MHTLLLMHSGSKFLPVSLLIYYSSIKEINADKDESCSRAVHM